ncbi:MAG TPA: DNA topoisomerase IV subunit A [Polyangia bacterium]|nr:DNA topoisomerase IV subunit A [Polyangia bacterium]
MNETHSIPLDAETQRRYLNYALSVITSRALPDVRDGLKPVQRRILFDMWNDLRLTPDAKFRKCAAVVGDVMAKYHPHGDTAIYDALVRMAQDFSLRYPVVEGQGNFGSLDGDGAAAMRYTECRLAPLAAELLAEIRQRTVDWRPNYDGTRMEPIVVPARLPHLLVNGTSGIAVGMATAIPPHNLAEVVDAAIALIEAHGENRQLASHDLLKYIKGPDFPTGGEVVTPRQELREIYETGQGSIKLRGEWKAEEEERGRQTVPHVIVTSIPYGPTKSAILQQIGDLIIERKLPQLVDVRDESTEDVRIVLELKKGSDPQLVMAYLFKHTPLQVSVQVNMTCLVPTDNPEVAAPERLDLQRMLRHFIDFRLQVVRRRFEHELGELRSRIHILEGYEKIYDAVDETIRIIRKSEGKQDASDKLQKRFSIDADQAEAILELKLYRLARLEILEIQKELGQRRKEAKHIEGLLGSEAKLWAVIKDELRALRDKYPSKRRTRMGAAEEIEFDPTQYIVHEDANVVLTRDGWVKRIRELKDISSTRTREGDEVVKVLGGNTKECVVFFTNFGSAYVCRIHDIPPSSGYGDPVQKLFKFDDGERVVDALSLDPRVRPREEHVLAVTRSGHGLRFTLASHSEPSTRAGRKFAKVGEGDEILGVRPVRDDSIVVLAAGSSHVLQMRAGEVHVLANPGKGVTVMKLDANDRLLAFSVDAPLVVETSKGRQLSLEPSARSVGSRGGKGHAEYKKESFVKHLPPAPTLPQLGGPSSAGGGDDSTSGGPTLF